MCVYKLARMDSSNLKIGREMGIAVCVVLLYTLCCTGVAADRGMYYSTVLQKSCSLYSASRSAVVFSDTGVALCKYMRLYIWIVKVYWI